MIKASIYKKLAVATASAIACTAIASRFTAPAQAAALNYNFKVNSTWGVFDGNFSIDDSSLTGSGSESAKVTAGTFKFYRPQSYQGNGYAALDNYLGEWSLAGAGVQLLGGQLAGITASGYELASTSGPIVEKWNREMTWNLSGNLFEAKWLNITSVPDDTGMNGGDTTTGTVSYQRPAEVVPQAVPEPLSHAGLALGAAGLFAVGRKKKTASLASTSSDTSMA
jgi:hypothetical protein